MMTVRFCPYWQRFWLYEEEKSTTLTLMIHLGLATRLPHNGDQKVLGLIQTKQELCVGCNRCVRECPMEMANMTFLDSMGRVKVEINHDKCIHCGWCITACHHNARFHGDDTEQFFADLAKGEAISLIVAPAVRTNIDNWQNLFTWLRQLGVKEIYDVSLGADICVWAHIKHIEQNKPAPMIAQPCPPIVAYCEVYRHDLIESLSPIHSPMACTSIYMKEYNGITGKIAALSPCIAKTVEFEATKLADYNITFTALNEYMERNHIVLPKEETDFDCHEAGIGSIFSAIGGMKENLEYYLGDSIEVDEAGGFDIYESLDLFAELPKELLPDIYDVLNCRNGCNGGTACSRENNIFSLNRKVNSRRKTLLQNHHENPRQMLQELFDDKLDLAHFIREYHPSDEKPPELSDNDINVAFQMLGKTDDEMRNMDCGACGSETCLSMARKIALGVNIPDNCLVKVMDDAKEEHAENIASRERLKSMEEIENRGMLLNVMNHLAIVLLAAANEESFEESLLEGMELIGNCLDTDSVQIWLNEMRGDTLHFVLQYGWLSESGKILRQTDIGSALPYSQRWKELFLQGDCINGPVSDLHKEDRDILAPLGVTSTIIIPLFYKDEFWGIFSVDDCIKERCFPENIINILNTTGLMLVNAINRNKQASDSRLQLTKLDLVVKATKIGLWDMEVNHNDLSNPNNTFIWSDEFRQMLGFKDESEFPNITSSWSDRLHPDDREATLNAFAEHLLDTTGHTPYNVEYRLKKKNGKYSYYQASGETIRDEKGIAIRVAGSLLDVTETKNILHDTEKQRLDAEAASQAKTAFLSTMSHEIRTPMNAILGITEIQLQRDGLDDDLRDALERIYNSGTMLLAIINDILDMSKIESGKLELLYANYDVISMISDTAQLNMMRIGSKPIEFVINVDENTPAQMWGDELRVKQILNNLLSNAFKYTAEGTVTLCVTSEVIDGNDEDVLLVFEVNDTGQGMSPEHVQLLFEEYSQFNLEANRSTEGTGLGMSITSNLVHFMSGAIHVESELGKGSTFTVRIPQTKTGTELVGKELADNLRRFRTLSKGQMKHEKINRDPMPYGSVLIVDDVETNLFVARGLLMPYGLKIETVDSGFAALDRVNSGNKYDIIFMDHMMPEMDGVETTKLIRDAEYKEPIVALTANAVVGQAEMFLNNGFDDFISKPIDIRHMNVILNKMIRDKQPLEVIEEARKHAAKKGNAEAEAHTAETDAHDSIDSQIFESFLRDVKKSLAALAKIVEESASLSDSDIRTYIIHTHGMKSALANIGQADLSETAGKLEQCGRDQDFDTIAAETPLFLSLLRTFVDSLASLEDNIIAEEDYDMEALREKLLEVKAACEDFDEDSADAILKDLKKSPSPAAVKELLDTVTEQLLHSDFDEAAETLNNYLDQTS
jgi:PAS domain S-box-containing protein